MKFILPLAGMLVTAVATVTAVVFCMAMGANSTPAQIRALKRWMAGIAGLGLAGIVLGVLLLRRGETNWAAGAAVSPAVVILVVLVIALNK